MLFYATGISMLFNTVGTKAIQLKLKNEVSLHFTADTVTCVYIYNIAYPML